MNADKLCVRYSAAAVTLRTLDILPRHAKAIDCSIRHEISADDMMRETGLEGKRLFKRDLLCLNTARLTALDPQILIVCIVLVKTNEHAAARLDAGFSDPAKNRILFDTLLRRFLILHCIASAAVQKTMVTGACAVDEVTLLDEQGIHAAHCEVTQNTDPSRATADHNDCRFFHANSPFRKEENATQGRFPLNLYTFISLLQTQTFTAVRHESPFISRQY